MCDGKVNIICHGFEADDELLLKLNWFVMVGES
jgi:hypothetical protein